MQKSRGKNHGKDDMKIPRVGLKREGEEMNGMVIFLGFQATCIVAPLHY